ncbi:hypothetical protein [Sinomonas sp. P10A9]|uniref:Uncharacterized protein n=1 Tax=Sinomonas puerhi TaxID=3238584 RepID=A0AB39LAQ8_9MICC
MLGPIAAPLLIAAATLTAAGIAARVAIRTLRQRDLADRKAEWWRRTQWAFDTVHADSASRRELALDVLDVLAESDLPTLEEVLLLETANRLPLRAAQGRLDAELEVIDNGDSEGEAEADEHHDAGAQPGKAAGGI